MTTLGKQIRKARIDAQPPLKQKTLAARAGLSQKYLSEIERDAVDPRFSVVIRIAQALQVSLDSLATLPVPPAAC